AFGIALDAERKQRTRQDAFEPALHPALEYRALPPFVVHLKNRLELRSRHRLPIRAAGKACEDLRCARLIGTRLRRQALEARAAAWGVARPFGIERPGHG